MSVRPLPDWLGLVVDPVLRATGARSTAELTGEVLRQWGSSEVWRLSSGSSSVIVKRAGDSQVTEADTYRRFVQPLGLPAPALLDLARNGPNAFLVLADAGPVTLEQEPSIEGFHRAVELLVALRSVPVSGETELGPRKFLDLAARARTRLGAHSELGRLDQLSTSLGELHLNAPLRVVHGDFVPKNLVTDGSRWTAVDWPSAYLAPQLADLHTLSQAASVVDLQPDDLVAHYIAVSGDDPGLVRQQVLVGAGCFYVQALCWIGEEGLRTVPESRDWVGGLLDDLARVEDAL